MKQMMGQSNIAKGSPLVDEHVKVPSQDAPQALT